MEHSGWPELAHMAALGCVRGGGGHQVGGGVLAMDSLWQCIWSTWNHLSPTGKRVPPGRRKMGKACCADRKHNSSFPTALFQNEHGLYCVSLTTHN